MEIGTRFLDGKNRYFIGLFILLSVVCFLVFMRFFCRSVGPNLHYGDPVNVEAFNSVLEMGGLQHHSRIVKLKNKYLSNPYSSDYCEVYCYRIEGFPYALDSETAEPWHRIPIVDSLWLEELKATLSFRRPVNDIDVLLDSITAARDMGEKWIPTINDLRNGCSLLFVPSSSTDHIRRNRLLIYDPYDSLLYYFNVMVK